MKPNDFRLATLMALLFLAACSNSDTKDKAASDSDFNPHPSAAYLSPEESMKSFRLQKGYKLELVASEPMVTEPVAIAWDGNARMYVAEMITYMQDADASHEREPRSRVLLLEDTDNDGKMDKRSVFIDSLLLPRMLQCVGHELLLNETNTINIYSYRDTDGDGKADKKTLLYKNDKYSVNDANMEHQRSGLDWNIDNWMYLTYDPVRFRYVNGKMQADSIASGSPGQWGLTHDNYGRLFYSSAGGETPVLGFQINPVYGRLNFDDQFSPEFQKVWPVIATPDVQGGEKRLTPQNTLNHFTGCCGQSIYRGDHLPKDMVQDYIVCEPVARLIRRAKVYSKEGKTMVENAYDKEEFIASADMNFRPVNSATGPDGNLYIVDMHRGIIQQGNWTKPGSFLRNKIDSLGLAKNIGHGRIYRVVYEGQGRGEKPKMLDEATPDLVKYLGHSNGWWRDNAQKEIIIRGDKTVVPQLQAMATGKDENFKGEAGHLARIHALWTLDGLGVSDKQTLLAAMSDENEEVRKAAIWISEPFIKSQDKAILAKLYSMSNDSSYGVRIQLLLSLYDPKSTPVDTALNAQADKKEAEIFRAVRKALVNNEEQRIYVKKLVNFPGPDRGLILNGLSIFKSLCASCHGIDGKGINIGGAGMAAPPLAGSQRTSFAEKANAERILLHGLSGPVNGKTYPSVMPSMSSNNDRWIASVLSYIHFEFGPEKHTARDTAIVKPDEVKRLRKFYQDRTKPWTVEELVKEAQEDKKSPNRMKSPEKAIAIKEK